MWNQFKSVRYLPNKWRIIHVMCIVDNGAECEQNQSADTMFGVNILDDLKAPYFQSIL